MFEQRVIKAVKAAVEHGFIICSNTFFGATSINGPIDKCCPIGAMVLEQSNFDIDKALDKPDTYEKITGLTTEEMSLFYRGFDQEFWKLELRSNNDMYLMGVRVAKTLREFGYIK